MAINEKLEHLSFFLNNNIYEQVTKHVNTQSPSRQWDLINDLVTYIELLQEPLNSNKAAEISLNLTYVRIHLCQRYCFHSAKIRFNHFILLIESLIKKSLLDEAISLPKRILSVDEYELSKTNTLPGKVINKISIKLSTSELFDNALISCCSPEVAKCLKEHVASFTMQKCHQHQNPLIDFLHQISTSHSKWYKYPNIIHDELKKYNEILNTRDIKSRPTSRSQYINVRNALLVLLERGLLHTDTHLLNFSPKPTSKKTGRAGYAPLTTSAINEKLKHMFNNFNEYTCKIVVEHIRDRGIKPQQQRGLINDLITYTELLRELFNGKDAAVTSINLSCIHIHLCHTYAFSGAKERSAELLLLIELLIHKGIIDKSTALPKRIHSISEYELFKAKTIPKNIIDKMAIKLSAQELFDNTLSTCCPPEIAKRLNEHVKSFKAKEHKSHRGPLVDFLNQVSKSHHEWYKHPKIIQGELLKFRGNLLNTLNRSTAYKNFQNVKNAISVLIEHRLLPQETHLPDNLRQSTNTDKVRKENPLIAQVDLFNDTHKQSYIDTPTIIQNLKTELSDNLKQLVKEAQNIVYEGFHKFLAKDDLIARSQRDEYLQNPELLVVKIKNQKNGTSVKKVNPFDLLHPLEEENRVAYYDYYFDSLIKGIKPHEIPSLRLGQHIHEYFGLTPLVSSAMQIIITEELGINPHSLYDTKVYSNGHGHEFVQVDDEGGVRIKTLKARARHIRTRTAKGSLVALSSTDIQDINAATCLKMALEMGSRTRESLGVESLWTCLLMREKAGVPWATTFQTYFCTIRDRAYKKSNNEALKVATLKKVRCSKGVLIYLESNGDTLKAATYYGNQVSTTLNRYIPKHLTELIYRVKIRSFQNILLFMAVASDPSPSNSLNMNEKDFKEQITKAFKNPDMGGQMFEKLTKPSLPEENEHIKYFCVSDKNIQLAIKYSKYGTDEKLKADCEIVLAKIAEGPVIMKQMLRKAHIAIQDKI